MSRNVPEHVIRQIVDATDFVALVSRYCRLKARGNKYWALCPFHKEKTPSLSIDAEKGLFYCFGCNEGGNVFTFLEKMEGLDFGQALQQLAAGAGVDLSRYRGAPDASSGEQQNLYEVNELAAAFYRKCFEKTEGGKQAAEYVAQRGINEDSAVRWQLGYAPEGWDHFLRFATGRRYKPNLLERAGLVVAREGTTGHYDRFRNRLMFPIQERGGRTVGFGGRTLHEEEDPKYLNTPETAIFSKGSCFYGLSVAKEAIRSKRTAVLVEGYTDVIMSHQFGVQEVVGVLGTSLTEDHARLLRRLCDRVILVFDADEAGLKSAVRSVEVLLGEDLDVYVATLPPGQDPCALLVEQGIEEFRKILDQSEDFFQFRLGLATKTHGLGTVSGRTAAFREVAELALSVKDVAKRDMIVRNLAQEAGITPASAWGYIERSWAGRRRFAEGKQEPNASVRSSADSLWASQVIGFLLAHPEFAQEAAERIDSSLLAESGERKVLERLLHYCREHGELAPREFLHSLARDDEVAIASRCAATADSVKLQHISLEERLQGLLGFLEDREERQRLHDLSPTTAAPAAVTTAASAPGAGNRQKTLTEDQLRAYYEKMRERDRRKRI